MVKNVPGNAGDTDSNPGLEKSPGAGNGNPLPYSCWEIPCTEERGGVQRVTESDTTAYQSTCGGVTDA